MSDLFAPLREPERVSALLPEEVRRRGDRLRRRRASLAVASAVGAVAMVVGGSWLVVADRTGPDSGPAPANEGPIPALFDLADGMPRGVVTTESADPTLAVCGEKVSFAERAIASQEVTHDGPGDFTIRALSVFPDEGTARAAATDLVAELERCPRHTDDRGREWTSQVEPTSYGDQGWVAARSWIRPGFSSDGIPDTVHLVRVGANLLVTHQREVHGVPTDTFADWTGTQVEMLMRRQMCLLTAEGCAWRADPGVLRPDGWGSLQLGMSRESLVEGGFDTFTGDGECTSVDLGSGSGVLSASGQLASVRVPDQVTTPDGIGVGSTRDEVENMYPFADEASVLMVRASPTADYVITFEDDRVTQLSLVTVGDECAD